MGEHATRKSDDQKVKIGTCEDMYYLRYEDRNKVRQLPNNLDPSRELDLRFRLPFPDEDAIRIGEYTNYCRGERLYGTSEVEGYSDNECVNLEIPDNDPGIIQLTHPSGLLVNVPCHHGRKLPEAGPEMKVFWNGKSWSLELSSIKNTKEGVKPVIGCRHCGHKWRCDWSEVMPYLHGEIKARLEQYAQQEREALANAVCSNTFTHLYAV